VSVGSFSDFFLRRRYRTRAAQSNLEPLNPYIRTYGSVIAVSRVYILERIRGNSMQYVLFPVDGQTNGTIRGSCSGEGG
jgi:hypothetical protein